MTEKRWTADEAIALACENPEALAKSIKIASDIARVAPSVDSTPLSMISRVNGAYLAIAELTGGPESARQTIRVLRALFEDIERDLSERHPAS